MKYLTMAINETFRLHPPVPIVLRQAMADTTIHGYDIPKGVCILHILTFSLSYHCILQTGIAVAAYTGNAAHIM